MSMENSIIVLYCLVDETLKKLGAFADTLHRSDGFPMPFCHFKRAYFSRLLNGEAEYGYCASKGETDYGFKGNVLINSEGIILSCCLLDQKLRMA